MSTNVRLASVLLSAAVLAVAALGRPARLIPRASLGDGDVQAAELEIAENGKTRTVRLPLPITIGRAREASLVLADGRVSRMHARIELAAGAIVVRDLTSRNGTWLNARPLDGAAALVPGDEIDVGDSRLVYRGTAP